VAELTDDTMPIGVLCIFIRKYSCAGLAWAGGRQYFAIFKPFIFILPVRILVTTFA